MEMKVALSANVQSEISISMTCAQQETDYRNSVVLDYLKYFKFLRISLFVAIKIFLNLKSAFSKIARNF